jgi:hypothetical protein
MSTAVQVLATPKSLRLLADEDRCPEVAQPLFRALEAIVEPSMDETAMQFSSDLSPISAYWNPQDRVIMVYSNTEHPLVNPMEEELFHVLLPTCVPLSVF